MAIHYHHREVLSRGDSGGWGQTLNQDGMDTIDEKLSPLS